MEEAPRTPRAGAGRSRRDGRSYSLAGIAPRPSPTTPAGLDTGRGVFETLLVVDGRPIEVQAHLARAQRSVEALYGAELPAAAAAAIDTEAAALELGRLRIDFVPRDGALAIATTTASVERDMVLPGWERALRLRPLPLPGGLGEHKWVDRELVTTAERADPGAVALIVDGDEALEGSRGNVFAVCGGAVLTPAADGRILPGVARARVIEIAVAAGVEVREQPLRLADLESADEAFLTGSVRGIEPVRAVGEHALRDGGPVTPRLAASLRASWLHR